MCSSDLVRQLIETYKSFHGHIGRKGKVGGSLPHREGESNTAALTYVKGKELSVDDMLALITEAPISVSQNTDVDPKLAHILHVQGFDGLPEVVDENTLDAHIAAGEVELFRGLDTADHAEQFRSGSLFIGSGIGVDGTYTTSEEPYARQFASNNGSILRMSLRKEARVINSLDLSKICHKMVMDAESEHDVIGDAYYDAGKPESMRTKYENSLHRERTIEIGRASCRARV